MTRRLILSLLGSVALLGGSALADIRVGTAGPLSNAEALFGSTWQNGMQLAIDEVNAAGGINGEQVVLVREDDGGDPKQGTLIAQKFCDDDSIVAVVANFNSGVTIPASDVYNRCGMPQVTNSSNPKVTEAGYENLFRPIANDFMQGGAPATYATVGLAVGDSVAGAAVTSIVPGLPSQSRSGVAMPAGNRPAGVPDTTVSVPQVSAPNRIASRSS